MADYITWLQPTTTAQHLEATLPFDPWMRKHVRLVAQVIKVAGESMRVEGSMAGCDLRQEVAASSKRCAKREAKSGRLYLELAFPRGLVPLRYPVHEDRGAYVEPNVWLYHNLG